MTTKKAGATARWLYAFLVFQFAAQSALVIEGLGPLRTVLRAGVYLSSVAMLVLVPAGGRPHPLRTLVVAILVVTTLGLLHPSLNTPAAGVGHVTLSLAVWGPVFWVARLHLTPDALRRVVVMFWAFQTLSATVGVLQVYDPDRFAPDPTFVKELVGESAGGLMVTLDDGRKVFRPTGLSDTPGGASAAGMFAVLTGFAVATSRSHWAVRAATVPAAVAGLFCIYLCQVRSALIVTAVGAAGLVTLLTVRGRLGSAAVLVVAAAAVTAGGFVWATSVGSDAVRSRLETLTEGSAADVYYQNRGVFLEDTLERHLPENPLGAGLGRWGMMNTYFGTATNPDSPPLWAEIQATGWVYDGGLPLLLAGYAALVAAVVLSVRVAATARTPELADTAGVVVAINVGVVVGTFGYPTFVSQTGLMFWVLNTALFAASVAETPRGRPVAD